MNGAITATASGPDGLACVHATVVAPRGLEVAKIVRLDAPELGCKTFAGWWVIGISAGAFSARGLPRRRSIAEAIGAEPGTGGSRERASSANDTPRQGSREP